MADENYVDLYKDEETGKVGTIIAGKDVVRLGAPEVLLSPDTPLLTNAQDVAGAINELFSEGEGGGDGKDIYVVNGSASSVTVQTVTGRNSDPPAVSSHTFSFTSRNFYKSTTITGTNKVITKTWTKNIITSISDSDGKVIFLMDVDGFGKVFACYDRNGNDILSGKTYGDSVFTSTPEGVALGWALAYCKEQDEETEKAIDAYEDGRNDNIEAGGDGETGFEKIDFHGSGGYYEYRDKRISDMGVLGGRRYYGEYFVITGLDGDGRINSGYIGNYCGWEGFNLSASGYHEEAPPRKQFVVSRSQSSTLRTLSITINFPGAIFLQDGTPYTGPTYWSAE